MCINMICWSIVEPRHHQMVFKNCSAVGQMAFRNQHIQETWGQRRHLFARMALAVKATHGCAWSCNPWWYKKPGSPNICNKGLVAKLLEFEYASCLLSYPMKLTYQTPETKANQAKFHHFQQSRIAQTSTLFLCSFMCMKSCNPFWFCEENMWKFEWKMVSWVRRVWK